MAEKPSGSIFLTALHRITWTAGALMIALPVHAQTGRDLGSVIAEFDQGFVCPQFRPDDAARRADMLAFSRAIASVGPTRGPGPAIAAKWWPNTIHLLVGT